jgi:hypothetical protein
MGQRRNMRVNVPLRHKLKESSHSPRPRGIKNQVTRDPLCNAGDEQRLQIFDPIRRLIPLGRFEEDGGVAAGAGAGGEGGGGGGYVVGVVGGG